MSLKTDIDNIKKLEQGITNNKVSKFAYTDTAYNNNDVNGVQTYNINNEQNIPVADADVLQVNTTITNKGYRAQASSLTRMLVNHFFGRVSYNLNKINDFFLSFLTSFSSYLGQPNGVATLDENGRIPYSQLPESAVEYKGEWDASTNTPTLVDGTGTNGSMYYVSVGGTQNLGSGSITFLEGDRIIYNGEDEVWQRLSGGTVKSVNSVSPDATGNVQLSFSNLDGTVANSQIANDAVTTAKIANANVTTAKIADANVTTAKIADNAVTNAKFGDVLPISKGGTGATTVKKAEYNLFNSIPVSDVAYSDDTSFACIKGITTTTEGVFINKKALGLWTYIQNKISLVLGLTASSYKGKANKAGTADTTKDINGLSVVEHYKTDNSGYPTYLVTHDITDWVLGSSTSDIPTSGFNGLVFSCRDSGLNWADYQQGNLFFSVSYKPLQDAINLYYNNPVYTPFIIKNSSNKYFLTIKMGGTGRNCYFFGKWANSATSTGVGSYIGTEILATDSEGTLPTGYTLVNSITNYAGKVLDLTPKYYDFAKVDLTAYATKDEVASCTTISQITVPSFTTLLGAEAVKIKDKLKQIRIALEIKHSSNSNLNITFKYGTWLVNNSPTFISGFCTEYPENTNGNKVLVFDSYSKTIDAGAGTWEHSLAITNLHYVTGNSKITIYLNYL